MSLTKDYYYQEVISKENYLRESLNNKIFEECKFINCSFVECSFKKCKFIDSSFSDCIISAVIPMESRFRNIKFNKCKVIGIDWTKTAELSGLDFSHCQINLSNFSMLKIPETKMVHCEAREVDFTETDLSQSNFQYSDFEKSRFFKTNLCQVDFKGATAYYIDLKNNLVRRARFSLPEALSLLKSLDIIIE